ncbi:MAG: decarboxylating NADP(+)-dependent phosphogluconate dehydrogenase [Trueperaceae bacterium]|nr:MAG: decarboxylating NADP(+)-dependent phosphogluconate dehydrogenase [Trueperaceae bacterium]
MQSSADIGLIGLAVMGQNLVLNISDHGYRVAVYNRTIETMREFLNGPAEGTDISGHETLEAFVAALKRPRKVMLMVKAGAVVDKVIEQLIPLLEAGDIIIDGGNSNYQDSIRRTEMLEANGLLFIGTGVSGGEEGARTGPSIMPGGSRAAWPHVREILQSISAHVDGIPCCDWVGENGAGHFVKMVHNGIEYGDMQLISEAYHVMQGVLGLQSEEIGQVFAGWNQGRLDSYLIEITADIFTAKDHDGNPLVEKILDVAGQKGTGKWTAVMALEQGVPLTLIGEAVFARFLSSLKDERRLAAEHLEGPKAESIPTKASLLTDLEHALYAAKIVSYAQGYMLMRTAAEEYGWDLDYGGIAQMWRGGCIIRSAFLADIKSAYEENPRLPNLLLAPYFKEQLYQTQAGWRRVVATAVAFGIPAPALSAAIAFFDGYRLARLPANLLQAQRDYFGAHTYERIDRPRGEFFHTNWTGRGGEVTSGSYDA